MKVELSPWKRTPLLGRMRTRDRRLRTPQVPHGGYPNRIRVADIEMEGHPHLEGTIELFPDLLAALRVEIQRDDRKGIRRSFVFEYKDGNQFELFMAAMAWGFGSSVRYKGHRKLLAGPPRQQIDSITDAVKHEGAAAGWTALYGDARVAGLGWGFGTKLLYFAGYHANTPGPRPLILDSFVRIALRDAGTGLCPTDEVQLSDYLEYLELAQQWANHPSWRVTPEVVEFALLTTVRHWSIEHPASQERFPKDTY